MANNSKYLIEKFGCQKKEVSEYLGISIQSLSAMFNSDNPRKFCNKLAEYLKINSEYITKDLDEKDERNIIIQHYGIMSTEQFKEKLDLTYEALRVLEEISLSQLLETLKEWEVRDIDFIKYRINTKYMRMPETKIKNAGFEVENNEILVYGRDYSSFFNFETLLIEKISKIIDKDSIYLIFELKNALNVSIDINYEIL